jgi:hypothetical protein
MKAAIITGSLVAVASLFLFDARPAHTQMMGWGMCREGYVYEPSRNVCVHKSKKAKRSATKKKTAK